MAGPASADSTRSDSGGRWSAIAVLMVAVVSTAVVLGACRGPASDRVPPAAQAGVLDLSTWDFAADGTVDLDGRWRLVWDALLPPDAAPTGAVEVPVPGHWTAAERDGAKLPPMGRATYLLQVRLPAEHGLLALRVPPVRSAFELFVDGRSVARGGRIGDAPGDVTPAYAPTTVFLDGVGPVVDLRVHVANAHHRAGGLYRSFGLGGVEDVLVAQRRAEAGDWLLGGAIFVMAIYHLGLFVVRRRERAPLYFALYCLLICIRLPLTGSMVFFDIFPEADLRFVLRFEYATFLIAGPFFCLFLASLFPESWHRGALRLIVGVGVALTAGTAIIPLHVMTGTLAIVQGLIALGMVYCGYALVRAVRLGREGAGLFSAAFAMQAAAGINDMLFYQGLSPAGPLVPYATFLFVFIQSFVLSRRFASAYAMSESYASTFRKFVPTQFLRRIAKEGLGSIRLGNVESDEITILFSDIRSFTTISEKLRPDQVFAMLNRYLSRMEPPIQAHGGFVDKYIGDAIMALFDRESRQQSAQGAVEAALGMLRVLETHNAELARQGRLQFETGIGIHSGEVMIGTVGSDSRMDSTAIGDAVNLAARIEGMTKMYGASLLLSEQTLAALGEARERYLVRFVDRVRVKGKHQPVAVYEVLGHADDPRLSGIAETLPIYADALERYLGRDFDGAAAALQRFLAEVPDDVPAAMHLDRCHQLADGVDDDWDGVVSLTSK